jgi:hypothetical protein
LSGSAVQPILRVTLPAAGDGESEVADDDVSAHPRQAAAVKVAARTTSVILLRLILAVTDPPPAPRIMQNDLALCAGMVYSAPR